MYSETVKGDHVGLFDCRQYSASKMEVTTLVQWIPQSFWNVFTRTPRRREVGVFTARCWQNNNCISWDARRCDSAPRVSVSPDRILQCPSLRRIFVYMWISHLSVVSLTNVISVISCVWGERVFLTAQKLKITLPCLFSLEKRNSNRQLNVSLWQFVINIRQ